ncbi:MAG: alkaline phosphatase PhoX [Polyangiales bacterium]
MAPPRKIPRRTVLRHGLAGLATVMAGRLVAGCSGSGGGGDGGIDGARADGGSDAGRPDALADRGAGDAGMDAGSDPFPPRDIPEPPALRSLIADIGPLGDPDENGVRLPEGFTSRVIARGGEVVPGSGYEWHLAADGGAVFATEDGGWIYACNSEVPLIGGVGAVRFDSSGNIVDAYPMLRETHVNCAGGKTPWHTWLSCEEVANGRVFECDPWGEGAPVVRLALGVFKHEAAAVDPDEGHVYLTEDEGDGCFYRFVPERMNARGNPDLTSGTLQVAVVDGSGGVTWQDVPDPRYEGDTPTRDQVADATRFDGGEGIWYHDRRVYFSTKGTDRIWELDIDAGRIETIYDAATSPDPILTGVDNVTVSCCGDVLVAEDGGDMQVVAILPSGDLEPLLQVVGQDSSEITGPAFDPSGTRLYFSSQRGGDGGGGITYEIQGPFHEPA